MIRISAGTASVLGLRSHFTETPPTTAYLMTGRRCAHDCSFCPRAKNSRAPSNMLSRVTWPEYPVSVVTAGISRAYSEGRLLRACVQVVHDRGWTDKLLETVEAVSTRSPIPLCVSAAVKSVGQVEKILKAGADRVSIALDAVRKDIYERIKGKPWEEFWSLLGAVSKRFPGRIGTHVIVGLGETEKDVSEVLQRFYDLNVNVGLFAFTPVRGTVLEGRPQPPLDTYRRIQAAHYLIRSGTARAEDFLYDTHGRITHFGMENAALVKLLADGEAFKTSGCPGCNRPFYNERPGREPYNYPRDLNSGEINSAIRQVLGRAEGRILNGGSIHG